MDKQIKDIREFQTKVVGVKEDSMPYMEDLDHKQRLILRNKLLREEVYELETALEDRDEVEVLDAGVDILYIVLGTMHEYGLLDKFSDAWDLIHANNMSKLGKDGKVQRDVHGKVIKPFNFKPVDLSVLWKKK